MTDKIDMEILKILTRDGRTKFTTMLLYVICPAKLILYPYWLQ